MLHGVVLGASSAASAVTDAAQKGRTRACHGRRSGFCSPPAMPVAQPCSLCGFGTTMGCHIVVPTFRKMYQEGVHPFSWYVYWYACAMSWVAAADGLADKCQLVGACWLLASHAYGHGCAVLTVQPIVRHDPVGTASPCHRPWVVMVHKWARYCCRHISWGQDETGAGSSCGCSCSLRLLCSLQHVPSS
jgi:hypothetical protein